MRINYSKNLRRSAMVKRVIALSGITALISFVAGGVSGYALKSHVAAKDKPYASEQDNTKNAKSSEYKIYDTSIFKEATPFPFKWSAGNDFTPIDCEICELTEELQEFIYYICSGYHVDFTLVLAVIKVESGFDIQAVSSTNDYGLMQINQRNHSWLTEELGITDYLDPYQNIYAGVFILRMLFERHNDVNKVLMAYNMGETGASRLWEKGIYEIDYTQEVLTAQQQFNDWLGGE